MEEARALIADHIANGAILQELDCSSGGDFPLPKDSIFIMGSPNMTGATIFFWMFSGILVPAECITAAPWL